MPTDLPADRFYELHERYYLIYLRERHHEHSSPLLAQDYFRYRMFERRDMLVKADSDLVCNMSFALHNYVVGGVASRLHGSGGFSGVNAMV
jgi:hypothetical protein